MTTKQADKLIKTASIVILYNTFYNETFEAVIVSRDRFNVYTLNGGCFDRKQLTVVNK